MKEISYLVQAILALIASTYTASIGATSGPKLFIFSALALVVAALALVNALGWFNIRSLQNYVDYLEADLENGGNQNEQKDDT